MTDTLIILLPIAVLLTTMAVLTYRETERREQAIVALIAKTLQNTIEENEPCH